MSNDADQGAPVESTDLGAATVDLGPDIVACPSLFGVPGERTGLGADSCTPSCTCGDGPQGAVFDEATIANLAAWALVAPLDELTVDPYDAGVDPVSGNVCVARFDTAAGTYELETVAPEEVGDGVITHGGDCGLCSTLQDLTAYVRNPDLTGPVRECGLQGIRDGEEANIVCLEALGFTKPCAQIWYYNTRNTRTACLQPCFAALNEAYHLPSGELNECLACDERESGDVFKSVAGRTRRNSGLASAICRPCDSVTQVSHAYPVR